MSRTSARELIDSVIDRGTYLSWDTPPDYGDIGADYAVTLERAREKSGSTRPCSPAKAKWAAAESR